MSGGSRLDHVYRSILMTRFFIKGWGKPENLKRLFLFKEKMTNRDTCYSLVPNNYPVSISKEEVYSDCRIVEGHFLSPFVTYLPGIVPNESETAYFQVVLPKKWNSDHYKPICLHLAGTGDHGFWRRRQMMAKPLLKEGGIASVILENPFYGVRKPKDQVRSSLHNVSDILVMGGCLILESLVLFHWCENNGFGPLGVTGMSMGGHMASLAATNWPKPIVLVPCLSWSSATPVFTQGVMSNSINWELLGSQYFADDVYREEIRKFVRVDKDAFRAGQQFAKHFPQSMDHICRLSREQHELNKGKDISNASQMNSKTVMTETQNYNSSTYQQTTKLSPSKYQEVISNSNCEVHSPASGRTQSSETEIVATESKLGPANVMISTLQATDPVNKPKSLELNSVSCPNMNTNSENVSYLAPEVTTTKSSVSESLLVKQKHWDSSVLTHFSASKLRILGSTNRDLEHKNLERVNKLKANVKESVSRWREDEAVLFMHGIMDECTHLKNFTVPVDTSLIIAICARDDAYVPREGCADLTDIWPGAEVRFLDAGHISAYLLHKHTFRAAIIESFQRLKRKYIDTQLENKTKHTFCQ